MQYTVIDIVDKSLTSNELKEIINEKLYNIIELVEFDDNYF